MWTIKLKGAMDDLARIATVSQAPTWAIHRRNEDFVLEADAFAQFTNHIEVLDYAREHLLPIINGIARLEFDRRINSPIEIQAEIEQWNTTGPRIVHVISGDTGVISATESASIAINGQPVETPTPPSAPSFSEVCTAFIADSCVRDALYYFSQDEYWAINLFKVFELVVKDLGHKHELVKKNWATQEELQSFNSVHDPNVIGRHARHAVHKARPLPNAMDEDQARAFIRRVLESWLREKYSRLRDNSGFS